MSRSNLEEAFLTSQLMREMLKNLLSRLISLILFQCLHLLI
ncbi:hypothetical protein AKJ16_DCAP21138 [Drosera capensis]